MTELPENTGSRDVRSGTDQYIAALSKQFRGLPEARQQEIHAVFHTPIAKVSADTLAVRSGDIVTTVQELMSGMVRTDFGSDGFMGKGDSESLFFVTPNYAHRFFSDHIRYRGDISGSLYDVIEHNTALYASTIAFGAAFMRDIVPQLSPDWYDGVKRFVRENHTIPLPEEAKPEYMEAFFDFCMMHLRTTHGHTFTRKSVNPFQYVLQGNSRSSDILARIREINQSHKGVVIAYSAALIDQKEFATDAYDPNRWLHSTPEMAIHPGDGIRTDTGTILSVEPLGDYEEDVIHRLGL